MQDAAAIASTALKLQPLLNKAAQLRRKHESRALAGATGANGETIGGCQAHEIAKSTDGSWCCAAALAHVCRVPCKGPYIFPFCHCKPCSETCYIVCSTVVLHLQLACHRLCPSLPSSIPVVSVAQLQALVDMGHSCPCHCCSSIQQQICPLCALQLQSLLRRRSSAGRQLLAWLRPRICSTSWIASAPKAASACQHAAPS